MRDKQRQKTRNRELLLAQRAFINNHRSCPCVDCGIFFSTSVMEFDHKNPEFKEFSVSRAMHKLYDKNRIIAEIAKCEIRCVNCHRNKLYKGGIGKTSKSHKMRYAEVVKCKQHSCTDCGNIFNHWQMDFDHRLGELKICEIASMIAQINLYSQFFKE